MFRTVDDSHLVVPSDRLKRLEWPLSNACLDVSPRYRDTVSAIEDSATVYDSHRLHPELDIVDHLLAVAAAMTSRSVFTSETRTTMASVATNM